MPYYRLHPDIGMNFQLNRVLTYGEEAGRLDEIQFIAARITDFASRYAEWSALAEHAEGEERFVHAAYAYRKPEFFLLPSDARKLACYQAFERAFARAVGAVYERKRQAVGAYRSIFRAAGDRFLALYEAEDQYYGRMLGVAFAEIFRSAPPLLVADPAGRKTAVHG